MKRSFRDPVTGVLKAYGYMEANEAGDVEREEDDDFALQPGLWKLSGLEWVPATPDGQTFVAWPGISG